MSQLSKNELKAENQSQFPNNNIGAITPSHLRAFNVDFIDSTVNQTTFNAYSASVEAQIAALDPSGSAESILALNAFTASQLNINSGVNSFTQSADGRLDALEAATSSYATSAITASSLITASFDNGTRNLTFTKGDSSTFNVNIPDVSGSSGNFVTTSSFNAFTQSIDGRVDSLEAKTGSYATTGSNSFQGNQEITGSISITNNVNAGTLAASTQIETPKIVDATGFGDVWIRPQADLRLDPVGDIKIQSSVNWEGLNEGYVPVGLTGNAVGFVATSSFGTTINTGSFATTGSNTFVGIQNFTNQITASNNVLINGDLTVNPTTTTRLNGNTDIGSFLYVGGGLTLNTPANITWLGSGSIGAGFSASVASQFAAITPTATGSLLTTASVSLNTITFTKGDSSTFQLTVDTGSGQSIPAGTISGSAQITQLGFVSSSVTASSLVTASISGVNITFTKGDGSQFTIQTNTGSVASASFAETASLAINAMDIIVNVKNTTGAQINKGTVVRIIGATGDNPLIATASWDNDSTSANTLGFVVTDIANDAFGRVMTQGTLLSVNTDPALGYVAGQLVYLSSSGQFTNVQPPAPYHEVRLGQVLRAQQNNGSIYVLVQNGYELSELHDVNINTGSLANNDLLAYNSSTTQWENKTINALGLATTGSNTFNGNQTINGAISASGDITGQALYLNDSINNGKIRFATGSGYFNIQLIPNDGDLAFSRDGVSNTKVMTLGGSDGKNTTFQNNPVQFESSVGSVTLNVTSSVRGTFDISGQSTGDGRVIMLGHSGSLVLSNTVSTATYAGLSHISSSQANANTNLIFKPNSNTGGTIVSGSANIFVNPTGATAGYVRYIGGTNNLFLNGQGGNLPQITGSAASVSGNRPTMNSNFIAGPQIWTINQSVNPGTHTYSHNIINGTSTMTFNMLGNTGNVTFGQNILSSPSFTINSPSASAANVLAGVSGSNALTITSNLALGGSVTYLGPVSSSTHTITNNSIQGGVFLNLQSGSRAYTMQANAINGIFSLDDNTVFAPTLGSTNVITNNIVNGNATFYNQASASFTISNNNLNGVIVTNQLDASSVTTANQRLAGLTGNALFGLQNNILYSGSLGTNAVGRAFANNLIAGAYNSASLVGDGGSKALVGTAVLGSGLSIFGTTNLTSPGVFNNIGSAFVGRYNATDGNRASTAETIFAVGTGVSGSFRKTGFLIDSGSNTFVEGTLNVSGSTSLTGSLTMTGSLNITGSYNVNSSSYNGQAITNITPVSSSLSPILNIVTMTTAEYALITPNSQTLYVIV